MSVFLYFKVFTSNQMQNFNDKFNFYKFDH